MKKSHIVKLILFPLILGGCIAALDLLLFQKVSDDLTSYGKFYEEEDNSLDVVLVGNSTLREGYSPLTAWKEEGIMSRGFSSSPTHPEVIKVAIKEIMRKYSPKAIFKQDYHVSLLIKVRMQPKDIATLTAHSKESVASTRSRLYQKVFGEKGSSKDWDDFVLGL